MTTLEADSTAIVPVNPVVSHAKAKMIVQNPRLSQLFTLARELGYALSPLDTLRRELSFSISTRLVTRLGIDVYQTAAYNLPLFPREAALQIFPDALKTRDRETPKKPESLPEMKALVGKSSPCIEPTVEQRDIWSHNPLPGETRRQDAPMRTTPRPLMHNISSCS